MVLHSSWASAGLAVALLSTPSLVAAQDNTKAQYIDWVVNATDVLYYDWYSADTGLWEDLWWNSGCILTSLGNFALINESMYEATINSYYETTYPAAMASNGGSYLNNYYDDEGWWALAWVKAYDVTGNTTYLDQAVSIFDDMLGGLNASCGGHWWDKPGAVSPGGLQLDTAIGNALYLTLGAALGNRIADNASFYQQYAQNEMDFFFNSGIIDYQNWTLYDQLDTSNDCAQSQSTWSYDEGAFMGGLIEFAQLSGNSTYLDIAAKVANGTIALLADPHQGVLTETNYPQLLQNDGAQFKGVFMRNLMYLQQAQPSDVWVTFIQNNANTIWNVDRVDNGTFGSLWQGPLQEVGAPAQGSALDCLIAAATVTTE